MLWKISKLFRFFYAQIKLLYHEKNPEKLISNWINTKMTILLIKQLLLEVIFQTKIKIIHSNPVYSYFITSN